MVQGNFIDDLVKCFNEAIPPGMRDAQKDFEKNMRAMMQSAFSKLDLVTREEFDVQASVLAKTRRKLEALEKQIAEIEKERHPRAASHAKSHEKGRRKLD